MTALLEVSGLATGYGDIRVVRDVSLTVSAGEVVCLLGRNGAGKTTTLRAIAGLNKLDHGTISLDGTRVDGVAPPKRVRRGLAYVQEGKRVFREMTVEQNLLVAVPRSQRSRGPELLRAAYDRFPMLAERPHAQAGILSGGQQQMLAIAQALVAAPAVVMLDEPSAGLAPTIVADILDVILALKAEGLGIILVEQSVDFALRAGDRFHVLDLGRIVHDARRDDEHVREGLERAYFSEAIG
jgi:branched-chain amino acid transport system ATP-binding protein